MGWTFKRKVIINELESILNKNDTIDAAVVAKDRMDASVVAEVLQENAFVNTKRNKRGKIVYLNQDEDHLEEQDNNETQEPVSA